MNMLREIIIRKERERQSIANDLEVAARIGLVISETNEAIQIKVNNYTPLSPLLNLHCIV